MPGLVSQASEAINSGVSKFFRTGAAAVSGVVGAAAGAVAGPFMVAGKAMSDAVKERPLLSAMTLGAYPAVVGAIGLAVGAGVGLVAGAEKAMSTVYNATSRKAAAGVADDFSRTDSFSTQPSRTTGRSGSMGPGGFDDDTPRSRASSVAMTPRTDDGLAPVSGFSLKNFGEDYASAKVALQNEIAEGRVQPFIKGERTTNRETGVTSQVFYDPKDRAKVDEAKRTGTDIPPDVKDRSITYETGPDGRVLNIKAGKDAQAVFMANGKIGEIDKGVGSGEAKDLVAPQPSRGADLRRGRSGSDGPPSPGEGGTAALDARAATRRGGGTPPPADGPGGGTPEPAVSRERQAAMNQAVRNAKYIYRTAGESDQTITDVGKMVAEEVRTAKSDSEATAIKNAYKSAATAAFVAKNKDGKSGVEVLRAAKDAYDAKLPSGTVAARAEVTDGLAARLAALNDRGAKGGRDDGPEGGAAASTTAPAARGAPSPEARPAVPPATGRGGSSSPGGDSALGGGAPSAAVTAATPAVAATAKGSLVDRLAALRSTPPAAATAAPAEARTTTVEPSTLRGGGSTARAPEASAGATPPSPRAGAATPPPGSAASYAGTAAEDAVRVAQNEKMAAERAAMATPPRAGGSTAGAAPATTAAAPAAAKESLAARLAALRGITAPAAAASSPPVTETKPRAPEAGVAADAPAAAAETSPRTQSAPAVSPLDFSRLPTSAAAATTVTASTARSDTALSTNSSRSSSGDLGTAAATPREAPTAGAATAAADTTKGGVSTAPKTVSPAGDLATEGSKVKLPPVVMTVQDMPPNKFPTTPPSTMLSSAAAPAPIRAHEAPAVMKSGGGGKGR